MLQDLLFTFVCHIFFSNCDCVGAQRRSISGFSKQARDKSAGLYYRVVMTAVGGKQSPLIRLCVWWQEATRASRQEAALIEIAPFVPSH